VKEKPVLLIQYLLVYYQSYDNQVGATCINTTIAVEPILLILTLLLQQQLLRNNGSSNNVHTYIQFLVSK